MSATAPAVVLLDVDGTLTDTNYLHTLAWRRAFLDNGHDVASWRIHKLIGAAGSKLMTDCIGRPDEDVKSAWRSHFDDLVADVRAFPGARDLVEAVRDRGGIPVLATSSPEDLITHHLDALGFEEDDFAVITTDSDVEHAKPEPDVFRVALETAGGRIDRAITVGDTGWDIDAATAAGLPTVAVCSGGWTTEELTGRGAVEVHDDVAALVDSLEMSAIGDLLGG